MVKHNTVTISLHLFLIIASLRLLYFLILPLSYTVFIDFITFACVSSVWNCICRSVRFYLCYFFSTYHNHLNIICTFIHLQFCSVDPASSSFSLSNHSLYSYIHVLPLLCSFPFSYSFSAYPITLAHLHASNNLGYVPFYTIFGFSLYRHHSKLLIFLWKY